jgi:uncharacterized membrane protein YccC
MSAIAIGARRLRIWSRNHRSEIRLCLRLAVSGVLALLLAQLLQLRFGLWAVLTAVLLTQMSVGKSVKATGDYLVGTLGGAVFAGVIGALIPHDNAIALAGVLALGLIPAALIAAENSRFSAAPFTVVLVLLAPTITHIGPVASALERLFEVGVGCLVGLVVSFVVLPARASALSIEAATRVLNLIAQELPRLLRGIADSQDTTRLPDGSDRIGEAYAVAQTMAVEGAHERVPSFAAAPDLGPLLHVLLALQHDLIMIGRTAPLPEIAQARLAPPLAHVAEAAAACLHEAGARLMAHEPGTGCDGIDAAFADSVAEVTALGHDCVARELPPGSCERIFALAFALEQLRRDLHALEESAAAFARASASNPQAKSKRKQPA